MRRLHKTVFSSGTSKRPPALIRVCLPALVSMIFVPLIEGDDEIPSGFKVDRYQRVWERNPFTLVAPVAQQVQPTVFDKLVLLSWMKAGSNDVVLVQNTENNEVQKITKEPNSNNLHLVEIHPNQNPQMVEAVLSNGNEQGSVKFKMDAPPPAQSQPGGQPIPPVANMGPVNPQNPMQQAQPPNGMAPQNGVTQLPRPGRPGQVLRQQAQENANLAIPNQPGTTPSHPGEIRRKRLAPPNAN
jgi:hypothetical protein